MTDIDYRSVNLRYLLDEAGPALLRAAGLTDWTFAGVRADGAGRVRFRVSHDGAQAALVVRYLDAQTDIEADPALQPVLESLVPLVERVAALAALSRQEGREALGALLRKLVGPSPVAVKRA